MKNRRILTVVLAVIMAFGLVACGGGNKTGRDRCC